MTMQNVNKDIKTIDVFGEKIEAKLPEEYFNKVVFRRLKKLLHDEEFNSKYLYDIPYSDEMTRSIDYKYIRHHDIEKIKSILLQNEAQLVVYEDDSNVMKRTVYFKVPLKDDPTVIHIAHFTFNFVDEKDMNEHAVFTMYEPIRYHTPSSKSVS